VAETDEGKDSEIALQAICASRDRFDRFKQLTDGLFRKVLAIVVLWFIFDFMLDIGVKSFEAENKEVLFIILTWIINTATGLLAFYYASTQSSQDKDKRISDSLNGGGGNIED